MTKGDVSCSDLREHLAPLVDGDEATVERFADHLASCDACRDLRHEASHLPELVARTGAGFALPDGVESRLSAEIDATENAEDKSPADERAAEKSAASKSAADKTTPDVDKATADRATTNAAPAAAGEGADSARRPAGSAPALARRLWLATAVLTAAAVLALVFWPAGTTKDPDRPPSGEEPGFGGPVKLAAVLRSAEGGGVQVRKPGAKQFQSWRLGGEVAPGGAIRTDGRTRAELRLPDGSRVVLDHDTELGVAAGATKLTMRRGRLVAEVAPRPSKAGAAAPLTIDVPTGKIEVLGTRFLLTATDQGASVRVTRGRVKLLAGTDGLAVDPGQEGLLPREGPARVVPAGSLAEAVSWSELSPREDQGVVGLGELRARKPGDSPDRERPLSIARQKVRVRIVGNVARTEVEQSFENDSAAVLEGIYRFPLPPDARIERLALDVAGAPGGFEEGAFVDRERAKKIWAGVIRKATPKRQRKKVEYVWVPGPWRDPALLQWKRGSNFELRVFPLPKRGRRTIILAYTQVLPPSGERRRYVYPLAHASDASTRVGRFELDVRVAQTPSEAIRVRGYPLQASRQGASTVLTYDSTQFVPSGDLVLDLQQPEREELQYWTFQGDVASAPATRSGARRRRGAAPNPAVVAAQQRLASDSRPFVLLSLRPELPSAGAHRPRDYAIVIDSSQSTVGERYARSARLAARLIREMDRRDRVMLLTCDLGCRPLTEGLVAPSAEAAESVKRALDAHTPAGSSNLAEALKQGMDRLRRLSGPDRGQQLLLVSDGISTVGHRSPGALGAVAAALVDRGQSISTVGIGGDADASVLTEVARAGGGHFVPYVPGQPVERAALNILETSYGATLEQVSLELPRAVVELAPKQLPNLRAGQELLVAARFAGQPEGELVLRGSVRGEPFKRSYRVRLEASSARGNAFVPRQWAALRIRQLESEAGASRAEIVALSKAFGVMSRHTSLLVLESPAMFSAFGVDRPRPTTSWTGDEELETGAASAVEDKLVAATRDLKGSGSGAAAGAMPAERSSRAAEVGRANDSLRGPSTARKRSRPQTAIPRRPRPRGGRWVKRVWFRVGSISGQAGSSSGDLRRVRQAQSALEQNPDSRDRHRRLVRALSRAGQLEQARGAAEAWLTRDQLDAEALVYLADAVGRLGQRERAIRLLSGIVDLEPDNTLYHRRLISAYGRAAMSGRVCDHRIALAMASRKARDLGRAIRCSRAQGDESAASWLLQQATDGAARVRIEQAAARPIESERVRGDIVIHANWDQPVDLDLSLITPQGTRVSWLGGRRGASARDALAKDREVLALRRGSVGSYVIELSRAGDAAGQPISGTVKVTAQKAKRTLRFRLADQRAVVGRIRIRRESRLENVSGRDPVSASLSRSEIARGMRRAQLLAQRCYDALRRRGGLKAQRVRLNPQITIAGNGRVANVRLRGRFNGTPLGKCTISAIRRAARFRPFGGARRTINFPLVLR